MHFVLVLFALGHEEKLGEVKNPKPMEIHSNLQPVSHQSWHRGLVWPSWIWQQSKNRNTSLISVAFLRHLNRNVGQTKHLKP